MRCRFSALPFSVRSDRNFASFGLHTQTLRRILKKDRTRDRLFERYNRKENLAADPLQQQRSAIPGYKF